VRGFLHTPDAPTGHGMVLTHGAGSNAGAPLLIAVADAFCAAGIAVLRCDLPFRQMRPHGPPGAGSAARDREGLRQAVTAMRKIVPGQVFLGGHSYGGRQASMLCAEETEKESGKIPGLLLLSYPLHPPRKSAQLRTQHFFTLHTPPFFVQGTRDPFGSIEEIELALKLIPAKTKLLIVEGAGHDLGFKGKGKREGLPEEVLAEFQKFL